MRALFVVMLLAGAAAAQPATGAPAVPAGSGAAAEMVPPPMSPPPVQRTPAELRQICVDAMNADPTFGASIVATVDKQIDQKTIDAHEDANRHIAKNERHVLYAYAAMWVIAALFVIFLWRRQRALVGEIAQLRTDLEAAAKEAK